MRTKFEVKVTEIEDRYESGNVQIAITRNGLQWLSIDLFPDEAAKVAQEILNHLTETGAIRND